MNKFIITLLILASSLACAQKGVAPKAPVAVTRKTPSTPKEAQHSAMHFLLISGEDDDTCTGYAIAEHVLLTAEHCLSPNVKWYVDHNKTEAVVAAIISDHHDHILLVMPKENFKYTVAYDPAKYVAPVQGEHIYFWGNPGVMTDIYREGYFAGTEVISKKEVADEEIDIDDPAYVFVSVIGGGDSGSALFDATTGALVGVVTYGLASGQLGGTYTLQFTAEQVAMAEGK